MGEKIILGSRNSAFLGIILTPVLWLLKLGITMLIHNKDDNELVAEFPSSLGHPVKATIKIT